MSGQVIYAERPFEIALHFLAVLEQTQTQLKKITPTKKKVWVKTFYPRKNEPCTAPNFQKSQRFRKEVFPGPDHEFVT